MNLPGVTTLFLFYLVVGECQNETDSSRLLEYSSGQQYHN